MDAYKPNKKYSQVHKAITFDVLEMADGIWADYGVEIEVDLKWNGHIGIHFEEEGRVKPESLFIVIFDNASEVYNLPMAYPIVYNEDKPVKWHLQKVKEAEEYIRERVETQLGI